MSDKDDLIVAGVNQKDKGIWRDFYNRYYASLVMEPETRALTGSKKTSRWVPRPATDL